MVPFKVGDDVVCINDERMGKDRFKKIATSEWVKRGNVYRVRWMGMHTYGDGKVAVSVRLEGLVRNRHTKNSHFHDFPMGAWRFRPLTKKNNEDKVSVTRKTDISIFKKMLDVAPVEEKKKQREDA